MKKIYKDGIYKEVPENEVSLWTERKWVEVLKEVKEEPKPKKKVAKKSK